MNSSRRLWRRDLLLYALYFVLGFASECFLRRDTVKILIVGTHEVVPEHLVHRLIRNGFATDRATNSEDGRLLISSFEHTLIVLGLGDAQADQSLLEFARITRKLEVPIFVLSEKVVTEAAVKAFSLGCDEYQQSDCHAEEFFSRITALIRRSCGQSTNSIEAGDIVINLTKHTITIAGSEVHLPGFQYQILLLFCMRKNILFTRSRLIDELYSGISSADERTVDVHIGRLRKALGTHGKCIVTVRGQGYKLVV